MNVQKIIILSIVFIVVLGIATAVIAQVKPQMHKTVQLEQIIFKRSTSK